MTGFVIVICAQIIDPFGVVIAQCQPQTDDVCIGEIDLHALSAVRRFINVGASRRHDLWPQLWKVPPSKSPPKSAPAAAAATTSASPSGSSATPTSTSTSSSTSTFSTCTVAAGPPPAEAVATAAAAAGSNSERRSSASSGSGSGSGSESDPETRRLVANYPLPKPAVFVVPDDAELERLSADVATHMQFGQIRIDPRCLFFQVPPLLQLEPPTYSYIAGFS